MLATLERRHSANVIGYHCTMSNTLILLLVLGVINFLIKKFASKPKQPEESQTPQMTQMNKSAVSMRDEIPEARAVQSSTSPSMVNALEAAARKFADQARALGLVDENGNYISSREPVAPVAAATTNPMQPSRAKRAAQKPITVTDFPLKAATSVRTRAVQSTVSPVVALSLSQAALVSKISQSLGPKKPISAIDALVASRLSQRIAPMSQIGQATQARRTWNAKSMRQGVIMAEILSPAIALR